MQRFKIFMGTEKSPADIKANKWLEENPNVKIIDMKYDQERYGDHSICILYKNSK